MIEIIFFVAVFVFAYKWTEPSGSSNGNSIDIDLTNVDVNALNTTGSVILTPSFSSTVVYNTRTLNFKNLPTINFPLSAIFVGYASKGDPGEYPIVTETKYDGVVVNNVFGDSRFDLLSLNKTSGDLSITYTTNALESFSDIVYINILTEVDEGPAN